MAWSAVWAAFSKALVMFLYFFRHDSWPLGIVLAVVLTTLNAFANADAAVLISLTVVNVPISLLVFYLCRNMLQFAELNQT
jgi:hypothetical protein